MQAKNVELRTVTGEEAKKAVDVILAIYHSAREGKEIIMGH
ncbi:hypothetical protein [Paenibacillus abyssi]|nr:hypothetical protein [Paenibacillus abyssi]